MNDLLAKPISLADLSSVTASYRTCTRLSIARPRFSRSSFDLFSSIDVEETS